MKFIYYICERDAIEIAHGNIDKVRFYKRRPKQCEDSFCDYNNFLEVIMDVIHSKKDAAKQSKNKAQDNLRDRLPRRDKRRS